MIEHSFWGRVEADWAGFSAEKQYSPPDFPDAEIDVFLGDEFDDEGNEVEDPPSAEALDQFQITFENFVKGEREVFENIVEKCFQRYLKLYAHHYEDSAKSGSPPLGVATSRAHFGFIEGILVVRVLSDDTIIIPMRYALDVEHGLEVRIQANKVVDIGGIAETHI
ncbi:DUF6985 domain-containing protein [Cognatiyoonia sp. IB215182]|uniref:DUF6985 domain-containing protein n=1 Tax=Cognatiyoonia sp. IB215182 TaxID=3097353 RepID=UPI002A13C9EF|nr:hypothetical protein [Cognatiyoonia sp. IB215182]MDX8354127.1 hypothetical protein [Cognatiyoonia sp. IB215182]